MDEKLKQRSPVCYEVKQLSALKPYALNISYNLFPSYLVATMFPEYLSSQDQPSNRPRETMQTASLRA